MDYVFSRLGTAEVATDPMGVNVADTYIMFKPLASMAEGQRQTHHQGQLANLMTRNSASTSPAKGTCSASPSKCGFNEILEGTRRHRRESVRRRLRRDRKDRGRSAGDSEKIPGAADVEFDALGKSPLLEIVPKREAMSRYNIHAAELNAWSHRSPVRKWANSSKATGASTSWCALVKTSARRLTNSRNACPSAWMMVDCSRSARSRTSGRRTGRGHRP